MNCHSERSQESPHFAHYATVYTFRENAVAPDLLLAAAINVACGRSYATLSTTARVFSGSGISSTGTSSAAGGPIFLI